MDKFYENIDSYISGVLEGKDLKAFEEALDQDPALQEEVRMYREVEGTLHHHFQHKAQSTELKETLTSLNKTFFQEEQKETKVIQMKPRSRMLKWAVAAAVVLTASFFIPRFFTAPKPTYANLAKIPVASFTEMGTGVQITIEQSEKAFNSQEYGQVVSLLEPYVADHPKNATLKFYLALANLETKKLAKAEKLFQELSKGDSVYSTESIWYLALLELKKGNHEQFQFYLSQVPQGSGHYEAARKLMR